MAFTIPPRINDDLSLIRLPDEIWDSWNLRHPLLSSDGIMGMSGRYGESEVQNTDKELRIRLDLQHFKPEEVKIICDNHKITIRAKHELKQDNHGIVSREITRIYKLPEDVIVKSITSTMNSNGILSIKAQKVAVDTPKGTPIPIQFEN